ncbi:uncharacterized protein LOC112098084 [Citrus clementina]|uniref:uncharacterized protein LOC112098084 n=1 Tax=Citrus clementina TaxID=85681 RepID=UPI000CECE821|nr:uncharacterized protein LOC112098084 [Citrus x clementina]
MDRSWITCDRLSVENRSGVADFLDFAILNAENRMSIRCPCTFCCNMEFHTPQQVKDHLFEKGFLPRYIVWTWHGETDSKSTFTNCEDHSHSQRFRCHDYSNIIDMVEDAYEHCDRDPSSFKDMLEDAEKPCIDVYDAYRKETFNLRAVLMWTISDFPAYGNLSGCTVKGYYACPICGIDTCACWLPHSRKMSYMGHRRFLPLGHLFRKLKKVFNGKQEWNEPPKTLSGGEIFNMVEDIDIKFGKKKAKKRKHDGGGGGDGKTKDGINARKDLESLKIRGKRVPDETNKKNKVLPPAPYTLSKKRKKKQFCETLLSVKVPDRYSSNVQNLVSIDDCRLQGIKSHDCHTLMQQFLTLAIRICLPINVRRAIIRMCFFFNTLCCKVVDPNTLDQLQEELVITLCLLQQYFPPSFFDLMIHLTVHLVEQVRLCGPVYLRWMYPFERQMKTLKDYVRNRYHPEGCIVESYIAEEALAFCAEYLSNCDVIGLPTGCPIDLSIKKPLGGANIKVVDDPLLAQAHRCVLMNTPEIQIYIEEHMHYLASRNPYKVAHDKANNVPIDEIVCWLANKPRSSVVTFSGYEINDFNFTTRDRDCNRVTQNSGVRVVANTLQISSSKDKSPHFGDMKFYGVIDEIWQLDYLMVKKTLFKCDWVDDRGVCTDNLGFTVVDLNRIGYKSDCFILACHAKQVFYVKDQLENNKSIVCSVTDKAYKLNGERCEDVDVSSPLSNKLPVCELDEKDDEGIYDRKDCDAIPIDIDLENQ